MKQRNAGADGVSRWLIHHAARRAPAMLSERLEEEWLADLAARPSATSRLRFAIGCCWATRVIAYEHQPATVRIVSAAPSAKLILGQVPFNLGRFSRRSSTAFLVVTLHIGLFYVLMNKLSHTHFTAPPPPFDVALLEDPVRKLPPPSIDVKIPPTVIKAWVPELPPVGAGDTGNAPTEVSETPPVATAPPQQPDLPPTHVVRRATGGPGAAFPNAEDFYPDTAKRLGEQGLATVQVCVDSKGRLTSEPTTVQSTGSGRLDEGALNLARAASGRYRPSTEDGKPVSSCYAFRIRFQLKN